MRNTIKRGLAVLAAGILGTIGMAGLASTASAVTSDYYVTTSDEVQCGSITITLHNVSPWIYPVSYSTDGTTPTANGPKYGPVVDNRGDAPDDQTGTKTLTFAEDFNGGEVTVKYVVAAGSEKDLYVGLSVGEVKTVTVNTDCVAPDVVETYSWYTSLKDGVTEPVNADSVTWPQTLAGQGEIAPKCGEVIQVDTYTGTRAEIDAVVGDGILDGLPPEDSGIVTGWYFLVGEACPVVTPDPTPVVTPEPTPVVTPATPDVPVKVQTDGGELAATTTQDYTVPGVIAAFMILLSAAGAGVAVKRSKS